MHRGILSIVRESTRRLIKFFLLFLAIWVLSPKLYIRSFTSSTSVSDAVGITATIVGHISLDPWQDVSMIEPKGNLR